MKDMCGINYHTLSGLGLEASLHCDGLHPSLGYFAPSGLIRTAMKERNIIRIN